MKKYLVVMILFASPALAEESYVEWNMTQSDANALMNALGEIPAKYSVPIINFLNQKEANAQKEKVDSKKEEGK